MFLLAIPSSQANASPLRQNELWGQCSRGDCTEPPPCEYEELPACPARAPRPCAAGRQGEVAKKFLWLQSHRRESKGLVRDGSSTDHTCCLTNVHCSPCHLWPMLLPWTCLVPVHGLAVYLSRLLPQKLPCWVCHCYTAQTDSCLNLPLQPAAPWSPRRQARRAPQCHAGWKARRAKTRCTSRPAWPRLTPPPFWLRRQRRRRRGLHSQRRQSSSSRRPASSS